jgi:hypothetical protein
MVLQQLRNQGSLNHLFMVEAEGIEEDEIPIYCNLVVARPND